MTGEAQYVDDLPLPNNALHAAFVLSTRPHAKILSIDSTAAEKVPQNRPACPARVIATRQARCKQQPCATWVCRTVS